MKISKLIDRTIVKLAQLRAVVSDASQTESAYSSSSDIVALEERIMLSATPMAVVANAQAVEPVDCPDNIDAPAAESQDSAAQEVTSIVFVDSSVEDYQQLVDDIDQSGGTQVVLIDSQSDGVDQISDFLSRHSGIESIHIVSHGTDGEVRLGNTLLNADTLERYAGQIAAWGSSLTSSADILFYGCDLAATEDGQHVIEALSELTGADVVASDDLTGNAELGGDWDLEYVVGHIETDVIFSVDVQQDWLGTLDAVTVSTTADVVDGDTSSVANLEQNKGADGEISLREAILATNNSFSTPDTIFLGPGEFILDRVGTNDGFGDLDISSNLEIIGSTLGTTVIDANALNDRVFDVTSRETTFRNLTIQGGETSETDGGGGILAAGGTVLNIDSVIFIDNTATIGAGLRSNATTLSVVNSSFINNHATEDGGAFALTAGTATVENSTASGNRADNRGGAVFITSTAGNASHQLTNLTLSGNTALEGGGLFSNGGTTDVIHATITDNAAIDTGGGIQRNSGDLQISNSIIAGNRALAGSIEIAGNISSGGKNIIGDNPGDSNGGGGYNNDLLNQSGLELGQLADNGGAVKTHALLPGSVGINDGENVDALATDARGNFRGDGSVDIGAYEFDAATYSNVIVVDTTADYASDDANYGDTSSFAALLNDRGADGLISLREAIDASNNTANLAAPDEIQFNLTGSETGYYTITPLAFNGLSTITDAVVIDATTQSGYDGTTPSSNYRRSW